MAGRPRRGPLSTVRARTTIAATLVVGAALTLGGFALSALLHDSLIHNIDDAAEGRADDIVALAVNGSLSDTIPGDEDALIQVLDARKHVVASTKTLRDAPALWDVSPTNDEPSLSTVDDVPGKRGEFRLLALLAQTADGPLTIYVATTMEPAEATLILLRTSLLIGFPLLLILVSSITWVSVGRALRPVEGIRSEVAAISTSELARRVPVPNSDDEIRRLAVTMNKMLDRLQASVERQDRFIADVSHELQTPLAAARADIEVALAHPHASDWQQTARDLLGENHRMETLVSDLLFIARLDDATPLPPLTPVDLHEIVLDEVGRLTDRTRVDTDRVRSAFVLGRRNDLARAIRNLLSNAERHAESNIRISLGKEGQEVKLSIDDDGPGVPLEDRAAIFERFTRLDNSRQRGTGGAGLGLAIVREIIERHGGRVTVEDGSPGAPGARFVITLPAD